MKIDPAITACSPVRAEPAPASERGPACDGELLRRFCEAGDEAGFREIVERHAAMVSSVCLSVLKNQSDAEDAFQATFFVLARKARDVRRRQSLSAWLHRVALRSALAARRKKKLRPTTELPNNDVLLESELEKISSRAVVSALHEELDRLPDKYRKPLIACYLEGAGRKDAAARLNLTEAALKTRLERARKMLRRRLSTLGLATLGTVALCRTALAGGGGLTQSPLLSSTVSVAMQIKAAWAKTLAVAAGNQASLTLAHGVLKTMMIATFFKTAASTLLGATLGLIVMTTVAIADDPQSQDAESQLSADLAIALSAAQDANSEGASEAMAEAVIATQDDAAGKKARAKDEFWWQANAPALQDKWSQSTLAQDDGKKLEYKANVYDAWTRINGATVDFVQDKSDDAKTTWRSLTQDGENPGTWYFSADGTTKKWVPANQDGEIKVWTAQEGETKPGVYSWRVYDQETGETPGAWYYSADGTVKTWAPEDKGGEVKVWSAQDGKTKPGVYSWRVYDQKTGQIKSYIQTNQVKKLDYSQLKVLPRQSIIYRATVDQDQVKFLPQEQINYRTVYEPTTTAKSAASEVEELKSRIRELEQIVELQNRVRELEAENAKLRARVEELEDK